MKAIILAAGRGSRMGNFNDGLPKCLIKVSGQTLLDWQVKAFREAGIEDISIVTGFRREVLPLEDLTEFTNTRWTTTNMVASLECASELLERDTCIVSYGDIFFEPGIVSSLIKFEAPLVVAYDPNWLELWTSRFEDPLSDAESFRIDSCGVITEIGGKPTNVDSVQGQYMGLLRFQPDGWQELQGVRALLSPEQRDNMHMTSGLRKIVNGKQMKVMGVANLDIWGEIDSESDVAVHNSVMSRFS